MYENGTNGERDCRTTGPPMMTVRGHGGRYGR